MHVVFNCPKCQAAGFGALPPPDGMLHCQDCNWSRSVPAEATSGSAPEQCAVCGCGDLWRQKDFPQGLGLFFVALGAIISTIAWAYHMPLTALGTLLGFAALDLVLYTIMPDVLVCYRCRARYRDTPVGAEFPRFNLETAERYRQEAARLERAAPSAGPSSRVNSH